MTDSNELLPTAASVSRRALLPSPGDGDATLPPLPSSPAPAGDEKVMSLVDHLSELRRRVFIAVLAIVVGSGIGFAFSQPVMILLIDVLPQQKVQILTVGGGFFLQLKIALVIGLVIASPVLLYQLWAFVSPGLTPRERSAARPWIPMAIVFFVLGVGVAYFTLPFAITFLAGFQITGKADLVPAAEPYFGFITTLFVIFGAVMEFPIALVLLSKLGILSIERLQASRRYVILGIVLFSVVITPGGDPFSPMVMSAVMYPLYEFTIFLLKRSRRNAAREGASRSGE